MLRNDQSDDCACNPWMRSACFGEHYTDEAGKRFCLLHFPNKAKAVQFKQVLDARLARGDAVDLSGAWFPEFLSLRGHIFRYEISFRNATFAEGADFCGAVFKGPAHFSETTFIGRALFSARFLGISNFVHATFHGDTSFCIAEFAEKGEFAQVTFHKWVDFGSARFISEADFSYATFGSDVGFSNADFHGPLDFTGTEFGVLANFDSSTFGSHVRFAGDGQREVFCGKSVLDLQHCRIARAEEISFHTVMLQPNWFVNVDSRKFVFAEIRWDWKNTSIKKEIERLNERQVTSPDALLATACRQLAENAELNNRYEEASLLRYWAMDIARRTKWCGWRFRRTDWLHILYWAVSGYGERIWLAFLWLLGVWIVFASLYSQVGFTKPEGKSETPTGNAVITAEPDTIGEPLPVKRALTYSLSVMSLQKPEPKPLTGTAQTLVVLETILGPVQAALLALAIRRKFMR